MVLGAFLSLLIGLSLGLLGGGGSILTVPILLYALHLEAHQAIAISLFVVGVTAASGMVHHARIGNVFWKTGLLFSLGSMVGAYGGGLLGALIPATVLLVLFAAMMVTTAVMMLRKRGVGDLAEARAVRWVPLLSEGLVVGAFTGMVGAGGGFLVVPALVLLAGVPMKPAIGTSLLVIALKSFAGLAGYAMHVTIDWRIAGLVAGMAILGSIVGVRLSHRVPAARLRTGFAWFVMAMAAYILIRELRVWSWFT